jgi:sigma-B regulation protein RsbU (phosphoserine phosphatase)
LTHHTVLALSPLKGDDLLFIFTDGLVEAENDGAEEFGEARLLPLLGTRHSAAEVIHRVMGGVEAFVGSTRQHDDITCLAMLRS